MSPEDWQALEDDPRVTIAANGSWINAESAGDGHE